MMTSECPRCRKLKPINEACSCAPSLAIGYAVNPARATREAEPGLKFDGEKTCLDLFPFEALEEISKVLTYGAKKYAAHNWRLGMSWSRYYAACLRHLNAWNSGQDIDPESGLSHLAHAGCCMAFLIASAVSNLGTDDRWRPSK